MTVTHQADRTRPERSASFPIEPRALLVPPGDARGEVPPLELRLGVPDAWIAIEVRASGGRPASGALVEAALQRLDFELQQPISNTILRCTEDGRARLAVWSGPAGARAALVARMADLASDIVELVPPWPEHPVELTLQPGAELRVRVADEAGQPVAGQAVQAALLGRSDFLLMSDGATETAGFVSFMPLPPGRYRAQAWCEALREAASSPSRSTAIPSATSTNRRASASPSVRARSSSRGAARFRSRISCSRWSTRAPASACAARR